MKAKRLLSVAMVALLMVALLSGCLNSKPAANDNQPKVLKILGYEGQVNEYGQLFEVSHDNITIEVIDLEKLRREKEKELQGDQPTQPGRMPQQVDMVELIKEAMTGPNAPDVVYLDINSLPKLVDDNLLQPLETFITKEKYDIDKIAPAVREGIKDLGNGTLYALAPTYYSSALYYNKDFFDARGVSYPSDGMTWEQIFNLARDLSYDDNGTKKYGFSFGWGDLSNQINTYSAALGLNMYDEDFKTFTVNTPEMERVWNKILQLNKDEVIAPMYDWEKNQQPGKYKPYDEDDFISGRAAMKIGSFQDMRSINDIFTGVNYWGPEAELPKAFEWDVVTFPVHDEAPGIGGNIYINSMMGISANAENPDLAWQYISFINGERVAKVLAKKNWELPARSDFAQAPTGLNVNIDAFTALKPVPYNSDNDLYQKFPFGGYWEIYDLNNRMAQAVSKGEKTVQEALAEYQTKGQEILDRLNEQLQSGNFNQDPPEIGIPVEKGEVPAEEEPADGESTDGETGTQG